MGGFGPIVTIAVGIPDANGEKCVMHLEKNTRDGLIWQLKKVTALSVFCLLFDA